jgi:hypothetical protein
MDFADEGTGRMRRPVDQTEEIVPPELEPVKAELAQVEAEFKEAVAAGDMTRMQTLANRMSKLNDEIATGLDAAKQNAIDVEGVRVGEGR